MAITYDKYGHCVLCHKNLRYQQVIDNRVIMRFSTEYDEIEFLLDDGSKMRVAICKTCNSKLATAQHKDIMDSVKAGWKEEVNTLPWDDEKKQQYIDKYSKREIVASSDNIANDILQEIHTNYISERSSTKEVKHGIS